MTLEPNEIKTIIDALYDAEILARRNAQEHAAYGTEAGKERAKEWREAANTYRKQREALHDRRGV